MVGRRGRALGIQRGLLSGMETLEIVLQSSDAEGRNTKKHGKGF